MKLKKYLLSLLGVSALVLTACDNTNTSNSNTSIVDNTSKVEETTPNTTTDENNNTAPNTTTDNTPAVTTNENNNTTPTTTDGDSTTTTGTNENTPVYNKATTIFLAGDSTVKTYNDDQYIGGWGQFLDLFLDDSITVKNAAQGGRSSRSFINEGRLYDIVDNGYNYSFSENGGKSIESEIKEGDYLFVQFGHNDDDTKTQSDTSYMYERMVPLGTPVNGIYPTIAPTNKQSTTANLPSNMTDKTKTEIAKYGNTYYAYDATGANGTYKGYLKEYIDFAREKGAIPVLVTPVARVKFSGSEIVGGPGLHGDNFAYVEAMKQLASEEDVMCIDLFSKSKSMLELATVSNANYLMALKPNALTGVWPTGYDSTYNNPDMGYEGIEATHYNKYGAYLEAAYVAEAIKSFNDSSVTNHGTNRNTGANGSEKMEFSDLVNSKPEKYVVSPNLLPKEYITKLEKTVDSKYIDLVDPNRTFPDATAFEAKLALVPAVDDITIDNADDTEAKLNAAIAEFNKLNVSDRKESYKATIDAVTAKIAKVRKDAMGTVLASISFNAKTDTISTSSTPFYMHSEGVTLANGVLKIGSSYNNTDVKYVGFKINATGIAYITVNAYKSDATKSVNMDVKNITSGAAKESVFIDGLQDYVVQVEINGETDIHIYRQGATGLIINSITVEVYEKK